MKRWLLIGTACLALAGCGQKSQGGYAAADNAMTADTARAPGIDVTAAPGVAFSYHDGFRLPPTRIAEVQEAHARGCEELGLARCRITGMRYRLLGENNIEGELDLKLAPAAARAFTKAGVVVVEHAGGTLVDAEITGTDTQPLTQAADTERARATAEVARLDAATARARSGTERIDLQQQRAAMVAQAHTAADAGADARASLASTPVTFRYESGPAISGFDPSAPFASAINTGIASVETTLAVVLAILAIFGPPAMVVWLVVWAAMKARARYRRRSGNTAEAT